MMSADLEKAFAEVYGEAGDFHVKCPGRVNIIGEHIDYSGYGVLPMAVEHSVEAVVRVSHKDPFTLTINNTDSDRYKSVSVPWAVPNFEGESLCWHHYFLSGFRGVFEHFKLGDKPKLSVEVLLRGSIPPSAGLSSSSALVCCAALCTARAALPSDWKQTTMAQYAQICADSEQFVGTQGGGMDQAISMMAQAGKATHIEFNPLRSEAVALPAGVKFVVAHSGVEMNKAATSFYNERVAECKIAASAIAKHFGISQESIKTLGDIQKSLGKTLGEMVEVLDSVFPTEGGLSRENVAQLLGITEKEVAEKFLNRLTEKMTTFLPKERAKHVYSEAKRVLDFKERCETGAKGQELGELMNASHESCRDLYDCSCPQLDTLVLACREAGALGSRLTGAGWGGCTVSLVEEANVDQFISTITKLYESTPSLKPYKEYLFVTSPSQGASITEISS